MRPKAPGTAAWLTLGALAAAGAWALAEGEVRVGLGALAWVALLGIFLARSPTDRLPTAAVTLVAAAVLMHVVSEASGLYGWGEWDKLQHFLLPFVLGIMGFVLVYQALLAAGSGAAFARTGAAAATVLLVVTASAAWELYEFSLDQVFDESTQHGLVDTMLDLAAGATAGVAAAMVGWVAGDRGPLRTLRRDVDPLGRALVTFAHRTAPGRSDSAAATVFHLRRDGSPWIGMPVRTADGRTLSDEQWKNKAHDVVFDALERSLEGMGFPASRREIIENVGDERVAVSPDIRLRSFLETLPEREFGDEDEVATHLNDTWGRSDAAP